MTTLEDQLAAHFGDLPPRCDRTWIETYTGQKFWPLNPRVDEIHINDIAHSLAMQVRYTGHAREFYSVAEHCCHVADLQGDTMYKKWALMHDAAEAYLADIATPTKWFFKEFEGVEDRILQCIAERFGIPWPMHPQVKVNDRRLYANERKVLMSGRHKGSWEATAVPGLKIKCWSWSVARAEFLDRFKELFPDESTR